MTAVNPVPVCARMHTCGSNNIQPVTMVTHTEKPQVNGLANVFQLGLGSLVGVLPAVRAFEEQLSNLLQYICKFN